MHALYGEEELRERKFISSHEELCFITLVFRYWELFPFYAISLEYLWDFIKASHLAPKMFLQILVCKQINSRWSSLESWLNMCDD